MYNLSNVIFQSLKLFSKISNSYFWTFTWEFTVSYCWSPLLLFFFFCASFLLTSYSVSVWPKTKVVWLAVTTTKTNSSLTCDSTKLQHSQIDVTQDPLPWIPHVNCQVWKAFLEKEKGELQRSELGSYRNYKCNNIAS